MSPRRATLLAFFGVLLAGIPLPALTAARREAPAKELKTERTDTRPIYATLQCSGQPLELHLRHEGRELLHLMADSLSLFPVELELELPATATLALELEARWPEGEQAQAATLTLEPEGMPASPCTRWTPPGNHILHSLFNFSW